MALGTAWKGGALAPQSITPGLDQVAAFVLFFVDARKVRSFAAAIVELAIAAVVVVAVVLKS